MLLFGLSLNRTICFYGPSLVVFDEFFARQDNGIKALYSKAKENKLKLPVGMTERMQSEFKKLIMSSTNSDNDLTRALACGLKSDLLIVKNYDKELLEMLDIVDYTIMNFDAISSKESELTCYRKLAYVSDILFRNTPLNLIDGEHSYEATKVARNINMKAVDDDDDEKKDLIGRKIDLIIKGSGLEMCSSEWKKTITTASIIEQQRIKNIRTNSAMLHKLYKLIDHDDLFLLGMDWVGFVGLMFSTSQICDVHCVHIVSELVFPKTMNVLKIFEKTLNLLYIFKHHNLNLLEMAIPAIERQEVEAQFQLISSSKESSLMRRAPVTFFTPKKRDKRN